MHRQRDLFEVVRALRPSSRFARRLHRGQQQRDKDGNNGDHHQQFNKCERCAPALTHDRQLRPRVIANEWPKFGGKVNQNYRPGGAHMLLGWVDIPCFALFAFDFAPHLYHNDVTLDGISITDCCQSLT